MSDNIYSYIEENFNIKITDYQFKRDYIKNPLKRGEKPYKDDLKYLYIILNLPYSKLNIIFSNISKRTIMRWTYFYQIKKDSKSIFDCICKTNLEKYGTKFPTQITEIRQKGMMTSLKKHGFKTNFCTKEGQENAKKGIKRKYNVNNIFQSEKIKEKIKINNKINYGVEYNSQREDVKIKRNNTIKERFNGKHIFQDTYIKNKIKNTNLKKYGVENYSQTNEYKKRVKQTNLKKYGVENPSQCLEIQNKKYKTMIKNHTFGKSKEEDIIYQMLCEKFDKVERQYKSKLYPFPCDFYVHSLDLYIEYQGFWTHNFEPYIGTDNQKKVIKLWESKNNDYYNDAIKTWSIRDPLKRATAKKNNLKWLEFFNLNQFKEWYKEQ